MNILTFTLSALVGFLVSTSILDYASASLIQCNTPDQCIGTSESDQMRGNNNSNNMFGGLGNDQLYGLDGDDSLLGDIGNDFIVGGSGGDFLGGDFGADRLSGGTGNDVMHHADEGAFPDGSRDIIDCGDGNDEVWISISDRDLVRNCEIIHSQPIG